MADHFLSFLFFVLLSVATQAIGGPPSPGCFPSTKFTSLGFYRYFRTLWGPQHQKLEHNDLSIWLDRSSGSGFKSIQAYRSGYFGASIKLQSGYTAGVITSLYLSNDQAYPGCHDEVDIEFLGTTFGQPYVLQTNVYIKGSGDGNIIGREVKFHLWFDPTQDFHHYAIAWSPMEIIFLVDDVPIRRYTKKIPETFPMRPMSVYGSIWDASSWATEHGKYKADYRYQPFVGQYTNFKISGCTESSPRSCHPVSVSPYRYGGLSRQQFWAMDWAQRYYKIYDYCKDSTRDHSRTPECYL